MALKFAWIIAKSMQDALLDLEDAFSRQGYTTIHGGPTWTKMPDFDDEGKPVRNTKGDILIYDKMIVLISKDIGESLIINPNADANKKSVSISERPED